VVSLLIGALIGMLADVEPLLCDRAGPEPVGFHARGFGYVVELFPPKSRHNPGTGPVAHFYQVEHPGIGWTVQARRLWTTQLANEVMPQAALVSMTGHVVTLDDYDGGGAEHALVVYDRGGRLVRSFALRDLLGDENLSQIPVSDCGWLWREEARFFFTSASEARLYVLLASRRVLEVTLATGELKRGLEADFPSIAEILDQDFPNEETAIWALNLRFAALSDFIPER
jgi:hypothetical protein